MRTFLRFVVASICVIATRVIAEPAYSAVQPTAIRYTWVAAEDRPFTDAEIKRLAANYSWVIIEKNHAGFNAELQNREVLRLKAANPNIHVFMNYLAGLVNPGYAKVFAPMGFKDKWYLRNDKDSPFEKKGKKIAFTIGSELHGYWVNLTNKEYRTFIENIIITRLKASSFDGVMLDNFRTPLGKAASGLRPASLRAHQEGLGLLLTEIKSQMPAGKLLLYNGITRGGSDGAQRAYRSLNYLDTADAAHDEYFCYLAGPDKFRAAKDVREDIDLLTKYEGLGKTLLYAVKMGHPRPSKGKNLGPDDELLHPPDTVKPKTPAKSEARVSQIKRYCLGCFLMGYQPGRSFIQFRTAATIEQGQLDGNECVEAHLDLGTPKSAYAADDLLLQRQFTRGWVFVNQAGSPREIVIPAELALANGGKAGRRFHQGDSFTLDAEDSAFFLANP